jgi:hypothetical protein
MQSQAKRIRSFNERVDVVGSASRMGFLGTPVFGRGGWSYLGRTFQDGDTFSSVRNVVRDWVRMRDTCIWEIPIFAAISDWVSSPKNR